MKTNSFLNGAAACLIAVTLAACDQSKNETPKVSDMTNTAAGSMMDTTSNAMDTAGKTMDAAGSAMTNTMSAVSGPFADGIAAAKKFMEEKNYQGALDELSKLSAMQLTPEQQAMVDNLKGEATKMLSGGATDAIKSIMPK